MVIAFISTIRSSWGGSEELWAKTAKEALQNTDKVVISAYDCGQLSDKTKTMLENGAMLDLRIGAIHKNLPKWKQIYNRIIRIYNKTIGNPFTSLFKYKPDIVLYIGTAYSIAEDFKLLRLVKKTNTLFFINVQLNFEEPNYPLTTKQKIIINTAYSVAQKVTFVSERNKNIAENTIGLPIPNALVVRNPVNISSTELISFPTDERVQFAMVGNLILIHKGQDIVLEALSSVIWKNRSWHLNIYGSGQDEAHLKKLVDFFGLKNNVTFHGRVSNIREVWQVNHILLMPSRMEGMPLAVVEAMICGRPSVVTDVGGHREWIEEGLQGFIAEAPSVFSFGKAMERAWLAKDNWDIIGQSAHEKAMKLYDPQAGKTLLGILTNG